MNQKLSRKESKGKFSKLGGCLISVWGGGGSLLFGPGKLPIYALVSVHGVVESQAAKKK